MSKRDFIKMILSSCGFYDIEINTYMSGTCNGQGRNETVWCVKALKKDARGDMLLDFEESTFDLFIHKLISVILPNIGAYRH